MTIRVRAPDGSVVNFPDGTPDATIERVMRQNYPRQAPQARPAQRGTRRNFLTEATQVLAEVNKSVPGLSEAAAYLDTGSQALHEAHEGRGVYGFLKNGRMGRPFDTQAQRWARARQSQDAMSSDLNTRRPNVAALSRGTGMAGPMLIPGGQLSGAANASRLGNFARAASANTVIGAGNRFAIGEGTVQKRLSRAADPMAIALDAGVGGVGGALAPVRASNRTRTTPNVQTLARESVQMTPGQVAGGFVRKMEDAATSLPIMGPSVQASRQRAVESMNRAQVNRSLRPIGQELPRNIHAGSEAIETAANRFSQRYQDIVPDLGLDTTDGTFASSIIGLNDITSDMTDSARDQLANIVRERVVKRVVNGKLGGPAFKRIESELREQMGRYTKSPDVDQQSIGRGLGYVLNSLTETLATQNPTYARALADTNKGYSRLASLETAAGKAGVIDGIVTPKQLREGFRSGDKSVRRRATAQGRRPDQAFYDAGASVLPSQTGDSGTAGRAAEIGLMGTAFGAPQVGIPMIGGLAVGAGAYSKPSMALFNKVLQGNIARRDRELALEQLGALAAQNPEIMRLYQQAATKLGYGLSANSAINAQAVQ
jgi:hypothetical protein